MMTETVDRVIEITRQFQVECQKADDDLEVTPEMAVCQDLLIFGIGVDDYAELLAQEFDDVIWQIPWMRFTDQTSSFRGWGVALFPPWLFWRLICWPLAGGPIIPRPDPRHFAERLTINHIAKVIDAGQWSEPNRD